MQERPILHTLIIISVTILFSCSSPKKPSVKIHYIAQSGVFIESDSVKICIDALFKADPRWPYPAPSHGLLDSMERAIQPFNDMDLFLITHSHIDHFNPVSLERALINNPKAKLITTPQVHQFLKDLCTNYTRIEDQICIPEIAYKSTLDTGINDIKMHISHIKHSDDKDWPAIVYAFLIEVNGKRILHNAGSIGCFVEEYKTIRYDTMHVDVAILYHEFLSDTSLPAKSILDTYIKPKHILAGHISGKDKEFLDSLKSNYIGEYPGLDVMTISGQQWTFEQ